MSKIYSETGKWVEIYDEECFTLREWQKYSLETQFMMKRCLNLDTH